jgi:hypothetical protein
MGGAASQVVKTHPTLESTTLTPEQKIALFDQLQGEYLQKKAESSAATKLQASARRRIVRAQSVKVAAAADLRALFDAFNSIGSKHALMDGAHFKKFCVDCKVKSVGERSVSSWFRVDGCGETAGCEGGRRRASEWGACGGGGGGGQTGIGKGGQPRPGNPPPTHYPPSLPLTLPKLAVSPPPLLPSLPSHKHPHPHPHTPQVLGKTGFTKADIDLTFAKYKTKGARRLTFEEFEAAVAGIAEKKGTTAAALTDAVLPYGPALSGTVGQANRLHDDKSNYTGVHAKGGPDTRSAKGTEGELSTHIDRDHKVGIRGV